LLTPLGKIFCSSLSKSRAKLQNAVLSTLYSFGENPSSEISPPAIAKNWEFAPRAASAILHRNIDYRRTDANLVRAAARHRQAEAQEEQPIR
jgi:hypothetical protein